MTFHLAVGVTFDSWIASPIHRYDPASLLTEKTTAQLTLGFRDSTFDPLGDPILWAMLVSV